MRMRRIHVLGVFSSLLFIFLLNQLIFGPQRSPFENNNVDAHGDWEKRLFEVKNGSRLDDSGALSLLCKDCDSWRPTDHQATGLCEEQTSPWSLSIGLYKAGGPVYLSSHSLQWHLGRGHCHKCPQSGQALQGD